MIDIIIPVYNTPSTDLERCFNSILNQTFKDYKVYIIDDGSNTKTRDYLDNYIKNKSNFIIRHIENKGVSYARNIGIEISNSNYITFVDADDSLEKKFLTEAYNLIKDNDLDIIIGGYNEIKNNQIIRIRTSEPGLHIYEDKNLPKFLNKLLTSKVDNTNKEIGDAPIGRIYTRLFKRKSIGNLRFNTNIHMSEDTLFMIDYTKQAHKIGIINKVWYNYYKNDYSISNNTKKEKMINNINSFINEIRIRMENESQNSIKESYQTRIEKATNYINKIRSAKEDH